MQKKNVEYGYSLMKQLLASAKFLYNEVFQEDNEFHFNIKMKKPSRIPVVLSVEEVQRLLNSFANIKHKAIFTLSSGLTGNECLILNVQR